MVVQTKTFSDWQNVNWKKENDFFFQTWKINYANWKVVGNVRNSVICLFWVCRSFDLSHIYLYHFYIPIFLFVFLSYSLSFCITFCLSLFCLSHLFYWLFFFFSSFILVPFFCLSFFSFLYFLLFVPSSVVIVFSFIDKIWRLTNLMFIRHFLILALSFHSFVISVLMRFWSIPSVVQSCQGCFGDFYC